MPSLFPDTPLTLGDRFTVVLRGEEATPELQRARLEGFARQAEATGLVAVQRLEPLEDGGRVTFVVLRNPIFLAALLAVAVTGLGAFAIADVVREVGDVVGETPSKLPGLGLTGSLLALGGLTVAALALLRRR